MHPLKHPRNAALLGIIFLVVGFIYWFMPTYGGWQVDYAGVTMLIFLSVAMGMMAYVLVAGSRE